MTRESKNTHDRQRELKQLLSIEPFNNSTNIGDIRRKDRQLLRQWAIANRREYGIHSIKSYCAYLQYLVQ